VADLYPELAGLVVPADKLMEYVFNHHKHMTDHAGMPYVESLPLEKWLRAAATEFLSS
jgi:hypothetical protein